MKLFRHEQTQIAMNRFLDEFGRTDFKQEEILDWLLVGESREEGHCDRCHQPATGDNEAWNYQISVSPFLDAKKLWNPANTAFEDEKTQEIWMHCIGILWRVDQLCDACAETAPTTTEATP